MNNKHCIFTLMENKRNSCSDLGVCIVGIIRVALLAGLVVAKLYRIHLVRKQVPRTETTGSKADTIRPKTAVELQPHDVWREKYVSQTAL